MEREWTSRAQYPTSTGSPGLAGRWSSPTIRTWSPRKPSALPGRHLQPICEAAVLLWVSWSGTPNEERVIELSELDSLGHAEVARIKAFISRTTDRSDHLM